MAPPLFQSRGRQKKDQSVYNSFYNIKKTKLSARYPFLPKKQIERKIKHLWERASVEKRAMLCIMSSSTTAKSPFKGTILQGLRKKKISVDQTTSKGKHFINGSLANVGGKDAVHTLRSSIKDPHSPTCGQQILRSSAKMHVSTRRVSFNLEQSSPSRPNTGNSILQQERDAEKMEREKSKTANDASPGHLKKRVLSLEEKKMEREKSKKTKGASPGHLKKRVLSLEEEKMYKFEDEDAGGGMTQLRAEVKEHVFDPEEYNLESTLNSKIFKVDSQSPMNTPEQRPSKSTCIERKCKGESAQKQDKKTSTRKNPKRIRNSTVIQNKGQDVKKRNELNGAGRGRRDDSPFTKGDIDTSQSDDTGEVPWLVTAHPDSSSDEAQDNSADDDEEQEAVYEYYHKSSGESSAPTLPSLSQESEDVSSIPFENETSFRWNGVCFTKNSASLATEAFDSQLSLVSMDAAEVMSLSTEASMSQDSPLSEFGLPGIPTTSSPQWSLSPPENKSKSVSPHKQRMRLRDGVTMESPTSSRDYGLDTEGPRRLENVMQAPTMILSPASRKRKMRGQRGEDLVSMTTARKTKENDDDAPDLPKRPVAVRGPSLVLSNQRNVLAQTNSRPANPAPKTNKTKREKEDRVPKVKTRRLGRMRNKEGMTNGSQTEESSSPEGGNKGPGRRDAQRAPQLNHSAEDLPHRNGDTKRGSKRFSQRKEIDEVFESDGILCDLFQPNISSDKRSFNPSSETELYQSCMDPVSSHLFLEEKFFL